MAAAASITYVGDTVRSSNTGHRLVGRDARADRAPTLPLAAPFGARAEQALDAQHVVARRVGREPFAEQFRHAVNAARIGRSASVYGRSREAVEDEIRAVVHERRAGIRGCPRQRLDGEHVDAQRVNRMVLSGIHLRCTPRS